MLPPASFLRQLVTSGITRAIDKDAQYRWDLLVSEYIAAPIWEMRGMIPFVEYHRA